jgi:hypothetical protein
LPTFTFYLHEGCDSVPNFEIGIFDDVDPALEHGAQLLKDRPRYRYVEITRDDESVGRITRPRGKEPPERGEGA